MVRMSHALFALPFAASAAVLVSDGARLSPIRLAWIALAVVAARTAAMAMNRIADRVFDAQNPRTARRELCTGEVTLAGAWTLLITSSLTFLGAALALGPLCAALALPVLGVLLGYSYAKRFTWAVHLWLGVAQALGPIGVAVALTGTLPPAAVLLGLGVGAWVAGFDLLYAIQDAGFDRAAGLHSIPARFGVETSLRFSRALHLAAALAVAGAGLLAGRGPGWAVGSALLGATLLAEHLHVAPGGRLRPERIGAAFFTFNAFASVAFALCAVADLWVGTVR
jgi:4-hydroxybenzoate polyprenyltransferase